MYITYNNSTIATVQQITIYSQSSVVNTFIKPGIREPLVLKKKPNHPQNPKMSIRTEQK